MSLNGIVWDGLSLNGSITDLTDPASRRSPPRQQVFGPNQPNVGCPFLHSLQKLPFLNALTYFPHHPVRFVRLVSHLQEAALENLGGCKRERKR